jgi:nucleoside-diphosphate-sugar epimerase
MLKRMDDGRPAILLEDAFARFVPCRGYVENVARAIVLAIAAEPAGTRIYNVAEPDPYTEADWTAKVAAAAGWKGRVIELPRDRMPQHLLLPYNSEQHLYKDSTRIRQELGYTERVPVEEALRRTVEWERANPPDKIDPAQYDYAAEDAALA